MVSSNSSKGEGIKGTLEKIKGLYLPDLCLRKAMYLEAGDHSNEYQEFFWWHLHVRYTLAVCNSRPHYSSDSNYCGMSSPTISADIILQFQYKLSSVHPHGPLHPHPCQTSLLSEWDDLQITQARFLGVIIILFLFATFQLVTKSCHFLHGNGSKGPSPLLQPHLDTHHLSSCLTATDISLSSHSLYFWGWSL